MSVFCIDDSPGLNLDKPDKLIDLNFRPQYSRRNQLYQIYSIVQLVGMDNLVCISHRRARFSRRTLDLQGICLYEWNNNGYCRVQKISCKFKEPARIRQSCEKFGLSVHTCKERGGLKKNHGLRQVLRLSFESNLFGQITQFFDNTIPVFYQFRDQFFGLKNVSLLYVKVDFLTNLMTLNMRLS